MKRIFAWLFIAALLAASPFIFWRMRFLLAEKRSLAALRASHLPTTPAELNQWYTSVPDSENAAIVRNQAFELLREFPDQRSNWDATPSFDRREHWSDNQHRLAAQYLAMNAEALGKAKEGVQRSRCRYPVDFSVLDPELKHLAKLKSLALKAGLRASLAAEEKRGNDCVDDIQLMLHLAHTLDREPGMISQKVRNVIVSLAVQVTERALNLMVFDATTEPTLAKTFANSAATNSLQTALIGEVQFETRLFNIGWLVVRGREMNSCFSAIETNLALSASGPPRSLEMKRVSLDYSGMAGRQRFFLGAIYFDLSARMAINDATTVARIRLAQTALALERFRQAGGHLPEDLKELVPQFLAAVPADPFDGAPLRYRRLPTGYVIYSIGEDGHDDGGLEKPKVNAPSFEASRIGVFPLPGQATNQPSYDLTFIVER